MLTNLNQVKMNQTMRRGQLSNLRYRIPKPKKNRKEGTNGRKTQPTR